MFYEAGSYSVTQIRFLLEKKQITLFFTNFISGVFKHLWDFGSDVIQEFLAQTAFLGNVLQTQSL